MPLKTRKPLNSLDSLSAEERRTLTLAIAEARARGVPMPFDLDNRKQLDWNLDDKGYFPKNSGKLFEDREKIHQFVYSEAPFSAIFGGRGSGKTTAGAQKALRKIMQGKSGSVLNPDFENFKYSTWVELREWIPWNLVVPSQRYRGRPEWEASRPFSIVFLNGAKMYCKGLKSPDSARGGNLNWLWYDEGGRDETGLGWQIAIAGVRIGDDPQAWTTTTPKGTDHWCYKFFVEQDIPEEALRLFRELLKDKDTPLLDYQFVSIDENKNNLSPTFYAQMLAMYGSGYLKARELEGKFADEGGVLGDRSWFIGKTITELPTEVFKRVRYWDLAASEKKITGKKTNDPDSTVGTRMSISKDYPFLIEHQVTRQILWHDIKQLIVQTAVEDGRETIIYVEQEPGSGGKNQVAEIASLSELAGYTVIGHLPREQGDKVMRAQAWFSRAAMGLVYMVVGDWNIDFLNQLSSFPAGRHDDRIDSISGAFANLNSKKQWKEIPFMKI
jgi:predicted phage terminase large subunit-like protein